MILPRATTLVDGIEDERRLVAGGNADGDGVRPEEPETTTERCHVGRRIRDREADAPALDRLLDVVGRRAEVIAVPDTHEPGALLASPDRLRPPSPATPRQVRGRCHPPRAPTRLPRDDPDVGPRLDDAHLHAVGVHGQPDHAVRIDAAQLGLHEAGRHVARTVVGDAEPLESETPEDQQVAGRCTVSRNRRAPCISLGADRPQPRLRWSRGSTSPSSSIVVRP